MLWLLGWGRHTLSSGFLASFALACCLWSCLQRAKVMLSIYSCFCPGHSLCFIILLLSFCVRKVNAISISPLYIAQPFPPPPAHKLKAADCKISSLFFCFVFFSTCPANNRRNFVTQVTAQLYLWCDYSIQHSRALDYCITEKWNVITVFLFLCNVVTL